MFPSLLVVSVSPHNAHGILVPGGMFVSSLGTPKSQDTVIPRNKSHRQPFSQFVTLTCMSALFPLSVF